MGLCEELNKFQIGATLNLIASDLTHHLGGERFVNYFLLKILNTTNY